VSSPSTSRGVPDVSRLRPVQGRLSKARDEKRSPAQSKSIEHLFGRGRQSANQRITGGLVSHDQGIALSRARTSGAAEAGDRSTAVWSERCRALSELRGSLGPRCQDA
jgi:hypothetical protein